MRRLTRPAAVRAAVVGIALILVIAAVAALVVPTLIKVAPLRERLVTELSAQLHAQVDLAALHISLVPLPHVRLDQLRVSGAPTFDATIDSAVVYPRLWALLTGSLQPSHVSIVGMTVQLQLPREPAEESANPTGTATRGLREILGAALATVSSAAAARAPGLVVRLTQGVLSVTTADGEAFTFTSIDGTLQLPPDRLSIDVAIRSNLWEQATLRAAIDPASVQGDGQFTLTGLRPQVVSRHLLPADLKFGNGAADLDVHLTADGLDALGADVEATVPTLDIVERRTEARLGKARDAKLDRPTEAGERRAAEGGAPRASRQLTLEGAHVKATIKVDDQMTRVTLNDVRVAAPPLQLSGRLVQDRQTPQVRLELEGKDLDVGNAHEAAVFFAKNNRTVRAIFNILRAGTVPRLTVQAQGRTAADLDSLNAMLIRGALVGGKIRIPGNGVELEDVSGEVSVVNGVLIGEHAAARLDHSQARDGSVRVGLSDESDELSVTTTVQADVSDLPAVLNRLIANETMTRTLDRFTDVQGKAQGQLVLRGTTDVVAVAVEVPTFSVSAKVRDLNRSVQVAGGTFQYDAGVVSATGLKIAIGDSSLSEVSVRSDTSAAQPRIDISAGKGRITFAEIYPWMAASGWLPDSEWTPKTLSGRLAVESLQVRGPAAKPSDWRIELAGAIERLDLDAPRVRQVVALRFPMTIDALRLTRDPVASTVSMKVAAANGLTGNVDVAWGVAGLDIKRLSVRNAGSNATLSLQRKEREFDMTFAGNLDTPTLKALLPDEHNAQRTLKGDFSAHVFMDQPMRSTAKGRLEVSHVVVPGTGGLSVHITHGELRATGGLLSVTAEGDVGDDLPLHLHGALRPAADALIADLDVSAGQLDWARLEPLLPPVGQGDGDSNPTTAHPLSLRGKVRISADSFTYAGYTWKPLRAVVDLSGATPSVTITQASLCRIATPARLAMTPAGLSVHVTPTAKNQPLDQITFCLTGAPARMTGQCSLSAQVDAAGHGAEILTAAHGQLHGTARNGRIYQGGVLEKILRMTTIGYGSWNILSDLTDDGLPYNTIEAKGDFRDGKLVLTEATMDAPSMKIVAEGTIDVGSRTIDVILLVAPLRTADKVVSRIPIIGNVLGGNLLTIPVRVKGPLRDPAVTPLHPSEVGSGLVRVMTRIVKLPFRLIDPFLPSSGKP